MTIVDARRVVRHIWQMRYAFFLLPLLMSQVAYGDEWQSRVISALGNGGIYVEDAHGRPLLTHRVDEPFVPASTIKIATAACALRELGSDYRFATEIYQTEEGRLIVKGYGDPLLISEEIALMAAKLRRQGIRQVRGIGLDNTYFSSDIVIDGVERSANPFDAMNSALLANFNTVHVRKFPGGRAESAEAQTPLTPLAAQMVRRLPVGTHRINISSDSGKALQYVGELLAAYLTQEGVSVSGEIARGKVPPLARLVHRHLSSHPLPDILRGMLEHSTNLTANQLFLSMGAHRFGAPATVEKGVRVMTACLREQVGWRNFQIAEGSGLSRQTLVTPRQMMQLLRYFAPYKGLLPVKEEVFMAKTGTLNGANTFAGYFPIGNGGEARFVILVNDRVPFTHKFRIARMVYEGVNGSPGALSRTR
ncbi:MAG: D-alanyl-D-alanine carboxypeptidase [Deltaproteobacteria bacterium]|nr:D-alanyl-D-alanine carboxypeptidase [Deltaproteobacteria bacterium]